MSKKNKIICIILSLLITWCIIFGIDYFRCLRFKTPIFTIEEPFYNMQVDGPESHTCRGLGYHITYLAKGRNIKTISIYLFGKMIKKL